MEKTWVRVVVLAVAWQMVFTPWMMSEFWNTTTRPTKILFYLAFLIVPAVAGLVHRSWRVAVTAALIPILSVAVMLAMLMIIMGNGR